MKNKKLNLNKYAFLNYLKSDLFVWLFNNENFIKISQEKEYSFLKDISSFRYKSLVLKEKLTDIDKPSLVLDGIKVEALAQKLYSKKYKEFKKFNINEISKNNSDNKKKEELTRKILEENENCLVFEGTFSWNDFYIKTDILIKKKDKIKIIEVKASKTPLYYHALDIMFQKEIIKRSNIFKNKKLTFKLCMLNHSFIFDSFKKIEDQLGLFFYEYGFFFNSTPLNISKSIENNKYFSLEEVKNKDEYVGFFTDFENHLNRIKEIQLMDRPPISKIEVRNFQGITVDYERMIFDINKIPEKNSLFEFSGDNFFSKKKKIELLNENKKYLNDVENAHLLNTNNILKLSTNTKNLLFKEENKIDSIYKDEIVLADFEENSSKLKRVIQKISFIDQKKFILNKKIKEHFEKYKKVIYMFDFETVSSAIPTIDEEKQYEQIPYQYSIHVIKDKDDFDIESGRNIVHLEWLAENKENFYEEFWENFLKDMKKFGEGTFVSYNKSFENMVIQNRINRSWCEEEEKEFLTKMIEDTIDLMEPFKQKWYYAPEFYGSFSIKKVGPHFSSGKVNYNTLNKQVRRGDQSAKQCKIWLMNDNEFYDKEWIKIRGSMLEYCKFDTLLMVYIYKNLKEKIK